MQIIISGGRVIRQSFPDTGVHQFAYTLNKKTNAIQQTDVTDPRGTVRRFVFNATAYTTSDTLISGSAQQQTSYVRQSGSNFVTQMTDALGRRTDYTYDACGNLSSVTRLPGTSLAATTTIAYQTGSGTYPCIATFNRVTSVRDPINRSTTFGYDARGNLTSLATRSTSRPH